MRRILAQGARQALQFRRWKSGRGWARIAVQARAGGGCHSMRRSRVIYVLSILVLAGLAAAQSNTQEGKARSRPEMSATREAQIKRGKQVYDVYCGICHHPSSEEKKIGPGLKGIYKRGKFEDGKKVDDASMRTWIEKGGKDMPAFEETLTREEINALIAYLKTL
jgi:cytochrome c